MTKFILTTLTVLIASLSPVWAENKTDDVVVKLEGMTCQSCVQSLTTVFNKEETVNDVVITLDDQTMIIDTKDGMDMNDAKIKELIEWGGYDLISIKRN